MKKLKREVNEVIRRACTLQQAQSAIDIVEQINPHLKSDQESIPKIIKLLEKIRGNECRRMDNVGEKL